MIPATYNFSVVRGSAGPSQGLTLRLKNNTGTAEAPVLENMDFDDVRLSIYDKPVASAAKALIVRPTIDTGEIVVTNPGEAEVSWVPTAEDTRKLLIGPKNYYELEVRSSNDEIVYLLGVITGIGGLNDDIE